MKTLEELPIKIDLEAIAAFCRERGIRKLSFFGSVVREDFNPETSDVDVLVEFLPGRRVDLVTGLGRRLGRLVKDDLSMIYEHD